MKPLTSCAVLSLLISLSVGCAGSASGDKAEGSSGYSTDVGTATEFDFYQKTRRILDRYQYEIIRHEESADMLYLETRWKDRYPFQDEQEIQVVQAMTRVIVQARPRTRGGMSTSRIYKVNFIAENMVLFANNDAWVHIPLTLMCREYLGKFAEDLRTEFRIGIRKF